MKRHICILLAVLLALTALSGCDRKSATPEATEVPAADFAPEGTALPGALVQAAESQATAPESVPEATQQAAADQPAVQDVPSQEPSAATQTPTDAPAQQPFATSTPQPNASISGYSEVVGTGLGFRFNYPNGWNNIPGRSTVCYVQPMEEGTVYPARVAVTMKRLAHKCNADSTNEHKTELADYLKTLMTQYDEKTFQINMNLDESTKFMGNSAISTTYLAYDGDQEIQGYVILTYFERYLFVYHFLCAYEDYAAFEPAMRHMRDSVQADPDALDS